MTDEKETKREPRKLPDNFPIPKGIMDNISLICEAQGYGLLCVGDSDTGVHMILMGDTDNGINFASLYAAHILLGGVVHGAIAGQNEEAMSKHQEPLDKSKIS